MKSASEKFGFYAALLFLAWPFLAVVSAFKNYRSSWGKNILWAFVAFYGLSFAIGAENQGSDIVRYVDEVKHLYGIEMSVADAFQYYRESVEVDILRTFIAIVISRITDSQAVLTLIYGIIFGFFFSRNIWYVLEHLKGKLQTITILLLICFFLIIPIWYMNGFRMWTAAHIFIYGLFPFLIEGKKKSLFICASAILVHFSFIVPVGVLLGYLLLRNRLIFYFGFFIITTFISEIDLEVFNRLVENYAPGIIQERTESYRSETVVEIHRESDGIAANRVWYAIWYTRALGWAIFGFLVLIFLKERHFFTETKGFLNLFSFTLLFYGVANLLTSLPSGGRFITLANLMALAVITLYVQNREQGVLLKRFAWVVTPALMLYIIVAIRTGLYSMSATAILGNPVIALFLSGDHISLNDVMKMIL